MADCLIRFDRVGKKYSRAHPLVRMLRGLAGVAGSSRGVLRSQEFWALNDVTLEISRGECVGVIGPNGAGKSTLLKLVNGELRPDRGHVQSAAVEVTSLIRLGGGLQPLLTGRENIYVKCSERGFTKLETDALLDDIVTFSGLGKVLDTPVKHYSDGMYARLEFSIVTCSPMDVLLVDEVLAVGDIAFQIQCLERLNQLKRAGTAILFVSHSEMQVRQVADRCLLLLNGQALAQGEPDALFHRYHEAVGFFNGTLGAQGFLPAAPEERGGAVGLTGLRRPGTRAGDPVKSLTGQPLSFVVEYEGAASGVSLVLQFRNSSGLLMATIDSSRLQPPISLEAQGHIEVELPFLGLGPGIYRVSGGFRQEEQWLSFRSECGTLVVSDPVCTGDQSLLSMEAFCHVKGSAG